MPEENEKIEDFISLWKKKVSTENKSSAIGDSLNKIEELQKENATLKLKIAENLKLITKSEEMLKSVIQEKEALKLKKEENFTDISFKLNELQQENADLNNKFKNMVKLLEEKDVNLKEKEKIILNFQSAQIPARIPEKNVSNALIEELKGELSKKKSQIQTLEQKIENLRLENEKLSAQMVEELKSGPIDYVLPIADSQNAVIKPISPEKSSLHLETLCQHLQTDLNKSKRIIEKLTDEKSQLKKSLEDKGFPLNTSDIEVLKNENESLKRDLKAVQQSIKNKEIDVSYSAMRQVEDTISELEEKIKEKDSIIAELKLSQQTQGPKSVMSGLVENLQNQINKLKIAVKEKDQKILELNKKRNKV